MDNDGNLIDVLSSVIRGVIDGEISASKANAVCNTASQIVKIAQLKLKHGPTIVDSVVIPSSRSLGIASKAIEDSTESLRRAIFDCVSQNDRLSFKEIAEELDVKWEIVQHTVVGHEWFIVNGNQVSIA